MRIRTIISGCSVILLLAGCAGHGQSPEMESRTFEVDVLPASKSRLDTTYRTQGTVIWEAGDRIAFRFDDADATATNAACIEGGAKGIFRLNVPEGASNVYAVRFSDPDDALVSFPSPGKAVVSLPSEFDCNWTFDKVNALAGSASVDKSGITMKPVFGLLEFKTGRDDVDKVVFSCRDGAVLADAYSIDFGTGDITPSEAAHGSASFLCNCSPGPFFIPVPEGHYNGFSLELYAFGSSDMIGMVEIPAMDVRRGKIINLGDISGRTGKASVRLSDDTDRSAVCSFGLERVVRFSADGDWTVTASGDVSLDRTSGEAGEDNEIKVSFPENSGNSAVYSTLVFHSEGRKDVILTFSQNRKPDCGVVFRKYPDAYSSNSQYRTWTNAGGLFREGLVNGAFGYYTHSETGLTVGFFSNEGSEGNLQYNETGFMIGLSGNKKGGYVVFPAIEGKRLSKVELFTAATSINQCVHCTVCDLSGAVVSGGEEQTNVINTVCSAHLAIPSIAYELTNAGESLTTWDLAGTKPGVSYKLNFSSRGMVRWFTLYYE